MATVSERRPRRHVVAAVGEIPDGDHRIVTAGGRSIGVFHDEGRFYALRNYCPHHGAPLCQGLVSGAMRTSAPQTYDYDAEDRVVRCPWHGFAYSLRDGSAHTGATGPVRAYRVEVEGDDVVVYL